MSGRRPEVMRMGTEIEDLNGLRACIAGAGDMMAFSFLGTVRSEGIFLLNTLASISCIYFLSKYHIERNALDGLSLGFWADLRILDVAELEAITFFESWAVFCSKLPSKSFNS